MSGITNLVNHINLPRFVRVHQSFPHNELSEEEIRSFLENYFSKPEIKNAIKPKERICITCGSRGVSNMVFVTRWLADKVKELGAYPFLVPAMGSHGGATAEGQKKILESLGITEDSIGCPILSSMETVKISEVEDFSVNMDKNAFEADGVIVLNRIKAHTSFEGPVESGLMKMMAIGLGKQYGAHICHAKGDDYMSHRIFLIGNEMIKNANIRIGVGLIENAFDKTCKVAVIPANKIPEEEPKLLKEAKKEMGRIYLDSCDVLIVKELGKNYSGAGMDPNVTGRCANPKLHKGIDSQRLGIFDLTAESHGNATGMGRADLATEKFFHKISFDETYPNFITGYSPVGYQIPIIVDNEEEVMKAAVASCLDIDYENPRIIIVNNSLEIENILISEAMIPETKNIPQLTVGEDKFYIEFDSDGNMKTVI